MTFIFSPSARSATIEPILPQPMRPSVLPDSSTPMKRVFSHLPAWVERWRPGICRASANIMAMACSAVVMALPKGVFITTTPRAVAAVTSTLSTPMPARPTTLSFVRGLHQFARHLGGGAHGEAVVVADDGAQLGRLQAGLEVDLDAAVAEDLDGGGAAACRRSGPWACAQASHDVRLRRLAQAQSSQGSSASMSAVSTVAPPQMRRPGGASR